MSNKRIKRIMNELKGLDDEKLILEKSGIYFYYNETNINKVYALLVGPEKTPYEKGFYFFLFEYPSDYPMKPPIATYCTQGELQNPKYKSYYNVRFNPNLYVCGKVCLSMLNTWDGPGWVPTNTITNVLVAIQALVLNDNPLTNEPGFEDTNIHDLNKYNELIFYANIKISVLQMIQETPKEFMYFKSILENFFLDNCDFYKNILSLKKETNNKKIIISPAYSMSLLTNYNFLLKQIFLLEKKLLRKYKRNNLKDDLKDDFIDNDLKDNYMNDNLKDDLKSDIVDNDLKSDIVDNDLKSDIVDNNLKDDLKNDIVDNNLKSDIINNDLKDDLKELLEDFIHKMKIL